MNFTQNFFGDKGMRAFCDLPIGAHFVFGKVQRHKGTCIKTGSRGFFSLKDLIIKDVEGCMHGNVSQVKITDLTVTSEEV